MDIQKMIMDGVQDKIVEQIAAKTGLQGDLAKKAIASALPMVMAWLSKNADTDEWKQALDTALEKHADEANTDENEGSKILGHIFWNDTSKVSQAVATKAWVTNEQASSITSMLTSSVMWKLWAEKKAWNDVAWDLQKDSVAKSMLTSFLDKDGDGDIKDDLMAKWMDFLKKKFM